MKKIFLTILVVLLSVAVGYCQSQSLQVVIKSEKEIYQSGEDIYINFQIINPNKSPVTIAPPFDEYGVIDPVMFGGTFIISGGPNNISIEISPLADINSLGISPDKVIHIPSGGSRSFKVNILRINKDSPLTKIPYSSAHILANAGKYTVTGKYEWSELRKDYPVPNCWKGNVTSNAITIKVIEKKANLTIDPIDQLVERLSRTHGLWINGIFPEVKLSAGATIEQVLSKVFQMISFDQGRVTSYTILETREVQISGPLPDTYTAVLVKTNLGEKIVLLKYEGDVLGWWSRVYDKGL